MAQQTPGNLQTQCAGITRRIEVRNLVCGEHGNITDVRITDVTTNWTFAASALTGASAPNTNATRSSAADTNGVARESDRWQI